jgi:hypothetical protein
MRPARAAAGRTTLDLEAATPAERDRLLDGLRLLQREAIGAEFLHTCTPQCGGES